MATGQRTFKDYFSAGADDYAQFRPDYPPALFEYIASLTPRRVRAWDCATGNGQAAVGLSEFFQEVLATDASAKQIASAIPNPRVRYIVANAEALPFPAGSIDVVTIAQALHWFDFSAFYAEVNRVLASGGVIAAWTYTWAKIAPPIDEIMRRYARGIVGSYWPPERRHVDEEYRTIPFPFDVIETPAFSIEKNWTMNEFLGYLGTWSSSQQYIKQNHRNPVDRITGPLSREWGDPELRRTVRWKLTLRAGRVRPLI